MMENKIIDCKILKNAKDGEYDDTPWMVAELCCGNCEGCPHSIIYTVKTSKSVNLI